MHTNGASGRRPLRKGKGCSVDCNSAGPVPARKRLCTEIDAETMRKHGADMRYWIRGVGGLRFGRRHARARIPKPWVLAAFFGCFLPLMAESATQLVQNAEQGIPQSAALTAPFRQGGQAPQSRQSRDSSPYQGEPLLGTGAADCHEQRVRWSRNDRLQEARCKSRRGDVGIAPYEM